MMRSQINVTTSQSQEWRDNGNDKLKWNIDIQFIIVQVDKTTS